MIKDRDKDLPFGRIVDEGEVIRLTVKSFIEQLEYHEAQVAYLNKRIAEYERRLRKLQKKR
jgi:hypothetical protein